MVDSTTLRLISFTPPFFTSPSSHVSFGFRVWRARDDGGFGDLGLSFLIVGFIAHCCSSFARELQITRSSFRFYKEGPRVIRWGISRIHTIISSEKHRCGTTNALFQP